MDVKGRNCPVKGRNCPWRTVVLLGLSEGPLAAGMLG